jgi:molecular chaperone DnaK
MLLTHNEFAKSILSEQAAERLAQFRQHSVNARALGILVRDEDKQIRVPHYLLPANSQLPASFQQTYGTVVPNQRRVHLHIVESGTSPDEPCVELGTCVVEPLPENLPEGSEIEVTISYDTQARVHVSAREVKSGLAAQTEIVRAENVVVRAIRDAEPEAEVREIPKPKRRPTETQPLPIPPAPSKETSPPPLPRQPAARPALRLEESEQPIPLCNDCGEPLDLRGQCPACGPKRAKAPQPRSNPATANKRRPERQPPAEPAPKLRIPLDDDDEPLTLDDSIRTPTKPLPRLKAGSGSQPELKAKPPEKTPGEDEFWTLSD